MSRLDKVIELRSQVDQAHRQVAMAEGALERAVEDLSHGYGCNNAKDGSRVLQHLESKVHKLRGRMNRKLTAFEDKWKDQLES